MEVANPKELLDTFRDEYHKRIFPSLQAKLEWLWIVAGLLYVKLGKQESQQVLQDADGATNIKSGFDC